MRRWLLAAALLAAAWPALSLAGGTAVTSQLVECGTTRAHVAVGHPNRRNLTLFNAGTLHANVGGRLHSGANFQGLTLHVGATLELKDYQGGLDCQTQIGTGPTYIEVLEEFGR